MFDLRLFVKKTVMSMIGKEPEHKVRQYSLAWLEKDVLTQEDLAEIDSQYISEAEEEAVNDDLV